MPQALLTEPAAVFMTIMVIILVAPLLSKSVRLPGIVGLILGGMLVGQHGLNLLVTNETISLFGTVGLIYLMFNAGLEIDLKQLESARSKALVFAGLSFLLGELSGVAIGRFAGMSWQASLLLGSVYASQTLVAYPIVSNLGIIRNEAVAITVGATVFTDIAALLVLAVLTGSQTDGVSLVYLLEILLLTLGYSVLILIGVPQLGRRFFKRFSGDVVEFQFVLAVLFIAAVLAEVIGMHPIIGAFLAGLAINRTLSKNARVVGQLKFMGESLFVPLFLVTVGMRLDPLAILGTRRTWVLALALAAAVYLTKLITAWATGKLYQYSRAEILTMWGLSQAQAAATLATILVGTQAGILPEYVFDAAILTILLTSLTSPFLVERYGSKLSVSAEEYGAGDRFERILVPILGEQPPAGIIQLAGTLARAHGGKLFLLNIAETEEALEAQQAKVDLQALKDSDLEVEVLRRIEENLHSGVLRELRENKITFTVMPWLPSEGSDSHLFNAPIDDIIWEIKNPILLARTNVPVNAWTRIIIVIASRTVGVKMDYETLETVRGIAGALDIPLNLLVSANYIEDTTRATRTWDEEVEYEITTLPDDFEEEIFETLKEEDAAFLTTMGSKERFDTTGEGLPQKIRDGFDGSLLILHHP